MSAGLKNFRKKEVNILERYGEGFEDEIEFVEWNL